jgi:23S rRNA pseudouridine1911/1915/1917 synthase
MAERLKHEVDARDEGERADVVLARRHAELSRRIVRRLGLEGHLRVDGARAAPSTRVRAGQIIELHVAEHAAPEAARVLVVTERFVYVDKAAGVATHRLGPHEPPALADAVAIVHPECASASVSAREGGAVHRLDLETTGVVAFARDRTAWLAGRAAFSQSGAVDKRYVALARSHGATSVGEAPWPPPEDRWWRHASPEVASALQSDLRVAIEVRAPLGKGDRGQVTTSELGLAAHTTIALLAIARCADAPSDAWHAMFLLRLHTGRRHQARVHLHALGWPIVGDRRYGGEAVEPPASLMLHAAHLDLGATLDGEPAVQAPWPSALIAAADRARVRPSHAPGLLPPPSA